MKRSRLFLHPSSTGLSLKLPHFPHILYVLNLLSFWPEGQNSIALDCEYSIYSSKLPFTTTAFHSPFCRILHLISIIPFVARKALSAWFGFRFPSTDTDTDTDLDPDTHSSAGPKTVNGDTLKHHGPHTFRTMAPLLAISGLQEPRTLGLSSAGNYLQQSENGPFERMNRRGKTTLRISYVRVCSWEIV